MKRRWVMTAVCGVWTVVLTGCPRQKDEERLTADEARQAVEEASLASQAEGLTAASVEITTNFTIGQAAEEAAAEIRDFIASQMPCAELTLDGATLTAEYGKKSGECTYRGQQFSGSHQITVDVELAASQVNVQHVWTAFSNGKVELNGQADVTWDFAEQSRRVVHTAEWTRLSDGFQVTGEGDRTQTPLAGGLTEGFQVDGGRSWTSPRGTWDLGIDGVQMRWVDPVPQAGSYSLRTPKDKSLSLSFSRKDADTITVTVASGKTKFSFDVTSAGAIENS